MTGRPKDQAFHRPKGQAFDDLAKEQFATERARGTGSLKSAATVAGIGLSTAAAWEQHPLIVERVRELRAQTTQYVGASKAWVMQQLMLNVDDAREGGAFKASNEALMLIYKMLCDDKELNAQAARLLGNGAGDARDVQRRLRESFSKPQKALPTSADQMPPAPDESVETSAEEVH